MSDWVLLAILLGLLGIALVLAIAIGVPLFRGGYSKPHGPALPVPLLRWSSLALVLAPLCLLQFGYLSGRDVLYFLPIAAQTLWLSYQQSDEITERDA